MGDGDGRLDNTGGEIDITVYLDSGDDRYIGQMGIARRNVFGGDGNDTMSGNPDQDDSFDGGEGIDLLDFRRGPAVTLALDNSFAAEGAALGDRFAAFEAVRGSATGADRLRGDGLANVLSGMGGKDSLDGAAGADTLTGGNGSDTLTGGSGNDAFHFDFLSECGDKITDFANGVGDDDRFIISAAAFGGGLVAGDLSGTQFPSRADNLAQDSDDRFIFRTTDKTLWFDVDGAGGVAAILVADLQASANVTASGIALG